MRLLVVINHYFGGSAEGLTLASQFDPITRIAALSETITALHRNFGGASYSVSGQFPAASPDPARLKIVIAEVEGHSLLDALRLAPGVVTRQRFDGPPLMLAFESRRVIGAEAGRFDYYVAIEDDIILHDPDFFAKLAWFEQSFGPERLLMPMRYEMSRSGLPARISIDPDLNRTQLAPFRRTGQAERLDGEWHGAPKDFVLPQNPHGGGFFVSDAQLRRWMGSGRFEDRDASWIDPLVSAMNLSLGKTFDLYKPGPRDPFFLAVEHYGTRYARGLAEVGGRFGDSPLVDIAHGAVSRGDKAPADGDLGSLLDSSGASLSALMRDRDRFAKELDELKRSRSKLARALLKALLRR